MHRLGDAVVVRNDDRMSVGEVVGLRALGAVVVYDVSCETTTFKALFEDECAPATLDAVETELNGMVGVGMVEIPGRMNTREAMRRSLLRGEHARFLRRVLQTLQGTYDMQTDAQAPQMSFSIGDRVACSSSNAFDLGVVSGIMRRGDETLVRVEVMGEVRTVNPSQLRSLQEAPSPKSGLALGGRARFVAPGAEHDDSYVGTICRIAQVDDKWEYALVFDDGDVFEELEATDLQPL